MLKMLTALLGVSTTVVALSVLFGGGSLLWMDATLTDPEGFINTPPMTVEVDGFALTAGPAEVSVESLGAVPMQGIATIRIEAKNQEADRGLFLGVANTADVEGYLSGVPYAVLEGVEDGGLDVEYWTSDVMGALPGPPADQSFWTASASGLGDQVLSWDVQPGTHTLVVMNEDASEGMSFDAVLGARVPAIRPIGTGLLLGGLVMLATGLGVLLLAL